MDSSTADLTIKIDVKEAEPLFNHGDAVTGTTTDPNGKRKDGNAGTVREVIPQPDGSFS